MRVRACVFVCCCEGSIANSCQKILVGLEFVNREAAKHVERSVEGRMEKCTLRFDSAVTCINVLFSLFIYFLLGVYV